MSNYELLGAFGVAILLLAYLFILLKILSVDSRIYIWMNIIGAGISCFVSVLINYFPFVILEGAWTLVSVAALIKVMNKK